MTPHLVSQTDVYGSSVKTSKEVTGRNDSTPRFRDSFLLRFPATLVSQLLSHNNIIKSKVMTMKINYQVERKNPGAKRWIVQSHVVSLIKLNLI